MKNKKLYYKNWAKNNRDKLAANNRRWRYKHGANPNYYYSKTEKQKIIKLYQEGKSARQLGKMFNRDSGRLRKMLKREGIKLRTHREALALKINPNRDKTKHNGWRLQEWSRKVIERDGKCKGCDSEENLEAHHVLPKGLYPEKIYDANNGITLCHKCHKRTDTYGKRLDL